MQPEALGDFLQQAHTGDYVAIQAYLTPIAETEVKLQRLRALVRDRRRVATTLGFGPRFLHSTGQLHKGGPPSGVFLQLTYSPSEDVPILASPSRSARSWRRKRWATSSRCAAVACAPCASISGTTSRAASSGSFAQQTEDWRTFQMQLGFVGLGRMGGNMVHRLVLGGHEVVAANRSPGPAQTAVGVGAIGATSLEDLVSKIKAPRHIWLMLPAGQRDRPVPRSTDGPVPAR